MDNSLLIFAALGIGAYILVSRQNAALAAQQQAQQPQNGLGFDLNLGFKKFGT